MTHVTVVTGAGRHRDWSDKERLEILREAFSPSPDVSQIARRYDVSRGLIYEWRRSALRKVQEAFVPALIENEPEREAISSRCMLIASLLHLDMTMSAALPSAGQIAPKSHAEDRR